MTAQQENRSGFHEAINKLSELTQTASKEELTLEEIRKLTASTINTINSGNVFGRIAASRQFKNLRDITSKLDQNNEEVKQLVNLQQSSLQEVKKQKIGARLAELGNVIKSSSLSLMNNASDIAKETSPELAFIIGVVMMFKGFFDLIWGWIKGEGKQNTELKEALSAIKKQHEQGNKTNNDVKHTSESSNVVLKKSLGKLSNIEKVMKSDATSDERTKLNKNKENKERQSSQNQKIKSKNIKESNQHKIIYNDKRIKRKNSSRKGILGWVLMGMVSIVSLAVSTISTALGAMGTVGGVIGNIVTKFIPFLIKSAFKIFKSVAKSIAAIAIRFLPLIVRAIAPFLIAISPLFLKIGLIVAAISALYKVGTKLFEDISNANEILGKENVNLSDKVAVGIGSLAGSIGSLIDTVGGLFGFEPNFEEEWTSSVSIYLADFFNAAIQKLTSLFNIVTNFDTSKWTLETVEILSQMFGTVKRFFKNMLINVLEWFNISEQDFDSTVTSIKNKTGELIDKTNDVVEDITKDALSLLKDTNTFGSSILRSVKGVVNSSGNWLKKSLVSTSEIISDTSKSVSSKVKTITTNKLTELGVMNVATGKKFNSVNFALGFQGDKNITGLSEAQTRAYAANVAKTESRGVLNVQNKFGYTGQYQFGADAMADVGYMDLKHLNAAKRQHRKKGDWYSGGHHKKYFNNPENWLKSSPVEFKRNKKLQDELLIKYTNINIKRGKHYNAISNRTSPADTAAYAKAAHLTGAGGANDLFKRGVIRKDANNTSSSKYARQAKDAILNLAPKVKIAIYKTNKPKVYSSSSDTASTIVDKNNSVSRDYSKTHSSSSNTASTIVDKSNSVSRDYSKTHSSSSNTASTKFNETANSTRVLNQSLYNNRSNIIMRKVLISHDEPVNISPIKLSSATNTITHNSPNTFNMPQERIYSKVSVALQKEAKYNQGTPPSANNVSIVNSDGGSSQQDNPNRFRHPFPTRDAEMLGRIPISSRAFGKDYA
jgi:hypothetical protein